MSLKSEKLLIPGSGPMRTVVRLIDAINLPAGLIDDDGLLVYANSAWWQMVGDRPMAGRPAMLSDFVNYEVPKDKQYSMSDNFCVDVSLTQRGGRKAELELLPREDDYQVVIIQIKTEHVGGDVADASSYRVNSKEHLQSIIDAIPADVAWIGSDLCYRGVNRHLSETIDMASGDIVGQKVGFLAKREDTIGVSDDIADFVRWFFESEQQVASREWVGRLVSARTDLQNFAIYGRKYGKGDEAVFINIDITSRRRENELNRFQNRILGELIQNSSLEETLGKISHGLMDLLPDRRCGIIYDEGQIKDTSFTDRVVRDELSNFQVICFSSLGKLKTDLEERIGGSEFRFIEHDAEHVTGDLATIVNQFEKKSKGVWLCPLPDDSGNTRGAILIVGDEEGEPQEFTQRLLKAATRLAELSVRHDQVRLKIISYQNHLETLVEDRSHELRESEARFHNIAEWAPVMIWMSDKAGNITYLNQMCREFTGYTTLSDMDSNWRSLLHPDDHDRICIDLERVLGSSSHYESTWRLRRKDGEVRWVATWLVPRINRDGESIGMVGSSTDITDQLRAEEATRQLGMIVESSNNAIIGQDLDNRIVSWNHAAQELYGYSQAEAIGQLYKKIVPKDRWNELETINQAALADEGLRDLKTMRIRKDGRSVHVQMSVAPIKDLTGRLVGISSTTVDITEQKMAEQALHESEHRFRSLFETAGDGIFVMDHSGTIVDVNRQACESLLKSRHELIGMTIGMFSHPQAKTLGKQMGKSLDSHSSDFLKLIASMEPNVPVTVNLFHERRDGVQVPVEFRCVRTSRDVTGYILGIARDLTDRHRSEAVLRESEQQYRTLFEEASDLIFGVDSNGGLLFMNPEWMKRLGLEQSRISQYTIEDFIVADCLGAVRLLIGSSAMVSESQPLEVTLKTQDDYAIVVQGAVVCAIDSEKRTSYRGIFRDVTQQREVERIKDDLISTVSHELRTPLTSLRGYSELLLDREMSSQQVKEYVQIIHQETLRLNRLINDLLDIQKLETEGHDYHFESMDLLEILNEVIRLFSDAESTARIKLEGDKSLKTIGDSDRLRQVFVNLLSNAVKVSGSESPIIVNADVDGSRVVISVTDYGVGIPEHAIPKLFKKFARVDSPEHHNVKGTGLGLALAHEIVLAHRGRIWVESRYGEGSTFFVSLPVGRESDA
ncbi:MAG: PAS domain-containing sensor histidine kinase [Phycisphaerales bacterium]|nr:PAS domain-containing sensor histidine kinase [Phycisphaerales bacterium]